MFRTSKFCVCLALLFLLLSLPAAAQPYSQTVSGSLVPGGQTLPQTPLITTPNCTGGYVAFAVLYDAYPLTVGVDGLYHVDEPGAESAVYVLMDSFDPANAASTCIAASNTNPISLDVNLSAGVRYFVVVIEDTFAQDGMDYTLTVSGPGQIALGEPSVLAIPTLSTASLALLGLLLASLAIFLLRRRARA